MANRAVSAAALLPLLCLLAPAPAVFAQVDADSIIAPSLLAVLSDDADSKAPFFVVFGDAPDLSAAHSMRNKADRGRFVGQALEATASRSQSGVRGYLQGNSIPFTPFWVENKIYIPEGTLDIARNLARRPGVVAIVPEQVYSLPPSTTAASSTAAISWNLAKIRADQAWSVTTGAGISVANIDSGVQYNHPALVSQYRGNNSGQFTHKGNWYDPTSVFPNIPGDDNGHGTHTMGIIVGDDKAGNQVGVAPGARWIACKGCDAAGNCPASALIACAQWIMDPYGNGSYSGQPDIVNNSWGGGKGDTWYQSYVQNWVAAGIFPAFAAGNGGSACSTVTSPGDNPSAYAAGATDSSDKAASFSARGPSLLGGIKPNLAAPGVSIRSSLPGSGYGAYNGTSQASPHIAGAVALVWAGASAYRGNIADTQRVLQDSAVKLTTTENCGATANQIPNNTFGYGRLDALAALNLATGVVPNTAPVVTIGSPTSGQQFNCGTAVTFSGTASDAEDGDIGSSLKWSTGTTLMGTGKSIQYTFACNGSASTLYNVTASVTDSRGASSSATRTVNIVTPAVPAPTKLSASVSASVVNLKWNWAGTMAIQGFRLERKVNSKTAVWGQVGGLIPPSARATTDSPGKGGWQYRVFAVGQYSTSASSNVVSATVR